MNKLVYFIVFPLVVIIFLFLLNKLRQRTTSELDKILYLQKDVSLYLQLLKNPKLKLLYRKSTLLQFELNASLMSGDKAAIEGMFHLLDGLPMTKGESLEYNQKKLSYYSTSGSPEKAEEALNRIQSILKKAKKNRQAEFILKESQRIFDIYIRHDTALIRELEQDQKEQQGTARGLTLYRLAKLNYFDKNEKRTMDCLIQARALLVNTAWHAVVEAAMEDRSLLAYK